MKISKITTLLLLLNTALYADTVKEAPNAPPNKNDQTKALATPVTTPSATKDVRETSAAAPTTTPVTTTTPSPTTSPGAINCNYQIPPGQKLIDTNIISTFVENATIQAFTFSPTTIDAQMSELKKCFTDQGWKGFDNALQKSGNLESIKKHQLNVSSHKDGNITVNTLKDGQWKAIFPITVIYQNDKEKAVQELNISVVLGRKGANGLGIIQLIATTRSSTKAPSSTTTTPPTQKTEPNTAPTPTSNSSDGANESKSK